MLLDNKTVVLGVTGGIAAYKALELTSKLVKSGAQVKVIMTKSAVEFVAPLSFQSLSGNPVAIDTFDEPKSWEIRHISLAKAADVFAIVPCTANIIGKIAGGIADDMLTTTVMATKAPVLIAPAMNTNMFENPIVQDNLTKLKSYGYEIVEPASGYLACGDTGKGKMPEPEVLYSYILKTIGCEKDLLGKKVLITAGPTLEKIDPVRFISNHSTGKMGYAIAENAMLRGAEVTLVTGRTSIKKPDFVKIIDVLSAQDMFEAVDENFDQQDIVIMSAAVADYRPKTVATEKIKKKDGEESIQLERTTDILGTMSKRKKNQFVCGFSMETENMLENSKAKLEKKNLDMICANNLKVKGAGFGTDTNVVTLITKDNVVELPLESKAEVAAQILDTIVKK